MSNPPGFQHELSHFRSSHRGDILIGTVIFGCEEQTCPATTVKLGFREELGRTKPLQWPLRCPRCQTPLARYIGLEKGR
jgi:hypothetical protein